MKLTIERDALIKALAHVHGAVERRTTIPVLSMVKLEAEGDTLRVTATDLDLQATAKAPAGAIDKPGAVAAPAETLIGFVRKLPAQSAVTLAVEEGGLGEAVRLAVSCGRARMAIPVLPADDFPTFPEPAPGSRFSIGAPELRRLIDKTRFAISTEETRYYLNGIFMHFHEDDIRAVATDGHRLAMAATRQPDSVEEGMSLSAIVPRAACAEIRKLIADASGDVAISCDGAVFKVEAGDAVLATKVIDGTFPDYQRIIPKANPNTITVGREALAEAVGRVLIVSDTDARSIRLEVKGDALTVRARHAERGEAADEVSAESETEIEIGFNGKYLLEQLGAMEGDDVVLHIADAGAPARIEDSADAHVLGVLMPLRV